MRDSVVICIQYVSNFSKWLLSFLNHLRPLPVVDAKIYCSYSEASLFVWLRACSHEPRTVNCPGAIIARVKCYLANTWWFAVKGQQLHCLGQAHRHLNLFSFCTNCYREWILNTFTHFWCFLEIFIWKFIPNSNEHAQDYSCPGAPLRSVHMEKSYLGKASYLVMYNGGNPPLEVALGQGEIHVNSYRR